MHLVNSHALSFALIHFHRPSSTLREFEGSPSLLDLGSRLAKNYSRTLSSRALK